MRCRIWNFALMCSCIASACAQTSGETVYNYKTFAWMQEQWTGNDRPYQTASTDIRTVVKSGRNLDGVYDDYLKAAIANPRNSLAVYKWADLLLYAGTLGKINLASRNTSINSEMERAWRYIAAAPSPRTTSYARVRFIIEAKLAPRYELIVVAERLYKALPKDEYVAYKYAYMLCDSKQVSKNIQGIELAKNLLEIHQNDPIYTELVATGYAFLWFKRHQKADAKEGIAYFEAALKQSKDEKNKKLMRLKIDQLRKESGL